jgi:hypothetical protein
VVKINGVNDETKCKFADFCALKISLLDKTRHCMTVATKFLPLPTVPEAY